MRWIKIKAWHIWTTVVYPSGNYGTLCGRAAPPQDPQISFGTEATCESCLRIAAARGI